MPNSQNRPSNTEKENGLLTTVSFRGENVRFRAGGVCL